MKELLLLLARYPFEESNRESLAKLLSGVNDWEVFVKLVNAHGIIALSAYNIKEAGLEKLVPEKAMALMENGLMQSVVRNAWLAERWKDVNEILASSGIKHILLKGMALEHTIYSSKGLRQMTDNDILISKDESMKAWNLLNQNGFEPAETKSPLHRKIIFETGQHLPALFKDGYAVEIHTDLNEILPEAAKNYDTLLKYTDELTIGVTRAYKLKDDIHVKFLKDHFNRHAAAGECQLRSYNDIRLLDAESSPEFPESFILNPSQSGTQRFRKAHYLATVHSVPPRHRSRFVAGDIFPSVRWMKNRYGCSTIMAVLRYPQRIGKLLWLVKGGGQRAEGAERRAQGKVHSTQSTE